MTPPLIDTHAHLEGERFQDDFPEVLQRAKEAGLVRIVAVGITAETSETSIRLASEHPLLVATVGIHPNNIAESSPTDWDRVRNMTDRENVVGIGETGLDRYWDDTPFDQQEDYFARHLALSRETKLPVVIHCREADNDVVRMLRAEYEQNGPIHGVMHSFCGSLETAQVCLEMGLFVSFAGMVTFKKNDELRSVAKEIPLNRILVETDSPYLSPEPKRGKRNEPAHVAHTARCLADVRELDFEAFARQTTENAKALFGLA
ncbi:MAG: TatD family hydrolase [Gemmataceae bacterium]